MIKRRTDSERDAAIHIADLMCAAARTAPKARGVDNLEILTVTQDDLEKLIDRMVLISARDDRPTLKRDAENLRACYCVVVIGTKCETMGLNCGFCGYPTCDALKNSPGCCAYNPMDLGIALGSAASVAGILHADNRLMYSIGKAALELKLFKPVVKIAIGIPLSISGKSPFFDRK